MARTRPTPKPGLYVTATPIGNLGDITFRAVETLKAADLVLCEDTRQTAKLCAAYGIETPRAPYHDHNAVRIRPGIIKKLQDGAMICLVSDAGTPLISDPGYKLVREARDAGVFVTALPGASAAIAALSIAGAPSDQFFFAGFLPAKPGARRDLLLALRDIDATLVFYKSAQRLVASLRAMGDSLGNRRAIIARELSKIHEELREDDVTALASYYEEKPTKGEIVILILPGEKKTVSAQDLDAFLTAALQSESVKDAAAHASEGLGVPRKQAYARALALKENK